MKGKSHLPPGLILLVALIVVWLLYPTVEGFVLPKDPVLKELQEQLSVLHPRFKSIELYEGKKSYTLNKKHVYICLKDENGRYYNRNMLVYVCLHEYAHLLNVEIGHGKEFQQIFQQVLNAASERGLYNPSIPPLKQYCGVVE